MIQFFASTAVLRQTCTVTVSCWPSYNIMYLTQVLIPIHHQGLVGFEKLVLSLDLDCDRKNRQGTLPVLTYKMSKIIELNLRRAV